MYIPLLFRQTKIKIKPDSKFLLLLTLSRDRHFVLDACGGA